MFILFSTQVLEIRHIAGLVCKCLDDALTPKNIKFGFSATGICSFDSNFFSDSDFAQAVEQNRTEAQTEDGLDEDEQRRIVLIGVGREEDVMTTPEPSTSRGTTSRSSLVSCLLDEIGPLQAATPKKPSNRGCKPMQSAELTSQESFAVLKEKAARRGSVTPRKPFKGKATPSARPDKRKVTPAKRGKQKQSPPSDDSEKFCIVCLLPVKLKLTKANAIKCNVCRHLAHLKNAAIRASYFTCAHCTSDTEDEEEAQE